MFVAPKGVLLFAAPPNALEVVVELLGVLLLPPKSPPPVLVEPNEVDGLEEPNPPKPELPAVAVLFPNKPPPPVVVVVPKPVGFGAPKPVFPLLPNPPVFSVSIRLCSPRLDPRRLPEEPFIVVEMWRLESLNNEMEERGVVEISRTLIQGSETGRREIEAKR